MHAGAHTSLIPESLSRCRNYYGTPRSGGIAFFSRQIGIVFPGFWPLGSVAYLALFLHAYFVCCICTPYGGVYCVDDSCRSSLSLSLSLVYIVSPRLARGGIQRTRKEKKKRNNDADSSRGYSGLPGIFANRNAAIGINQGF